MLGWELTCVYLQIPGSSNVAGVMTSGSAGISNAAPLAVFDYIGCGYGEMLVSSISTTCGESLPFASTPGNLTFPSTSISGS